LDDKIDSLFIFYDNGIKDMSHNGIKTKELLEEEEEAMNRELEILNWSLKYLERRREGEPPKKKKRLDEQEILEWSLNFLKERKERGK
jgi:hypothetical protein